LQTRINAKRPETNHFEELVMYSAYSSVYSCGMTRGSY
jgi:hypothetical protein